MSWRDQAFVQVSELPTIFLRYAPKFDVQLFILGFKGEKGLAS